MASITITDNSVTVTGFPLGDDNISQSFSGTPNIYVDREQGILTIRTPEGATIVSITDAKAALVNLVNGQAVTVADAGELYDELADVMPSEGGGSFPDEVIETTVAELQALADPEVGATYKVTDPAGYDHPIYIQYGADGNWHNGKMAITNISTEVHICDVTYDVAEDEIFSISLINYNMHAWCIKDSLKGAPGGADPGVVSNCVEVLIAMIATGTNLGGDIHNIRLDNCRIDAFDDTWASQPIYKIDMMPGSWLVVGETAIAFPYYLTMQEDSKLLMKDGSQAQWCFFYSNSHVTLGENSLIDYSRFYDGAVVEIPANKTFTDPSAWKEYKKERSTFTDAIDIGADTTPDLSTVDYAGVITITCTAGSITITDIDGLTGGMLYRFYIASGKTITFDDGAALVMKGGSDFVGVGANGDWVDMRTNADATVLYEENRANY